MGKLQNGINDGFIGTVGTAVGYEWRGKWCMRSRPGQVRNPRSEPQQNTRRRLTLSSKLASEMIVALRIGMREESLALHITECNLFLRLNNEHLGIENGELVVDYGRLAVSSGPVAPVGFSQPAMGLERVITVMFDKNPTDEVVDYHDEVFLFAYCPETHSSLLAVPSYRYIGFAHIALPEEWSGMQAYLYGFVRDHTGRCSPSSCLGCVEC